ATHSANASNGSCVRTGSRYRAVLQCNTDIRSRVHAPAFFHYGDHSSDVPVQWPLAALDVRRLRITSTNTDGHRRANSPPVPPALRKAFSALSLINFSSARRYSSLAFSIRLPCSLYRMANSSRTAAISACQALKSLSSSGDVSPATARSRSLG